MMILGIDPGMTPGLYALEVHQRAIISSGALMTVSPAIAITTLDQIGALKVVCESFQLGARTIRASRAGTHHTLDQIGAIKALTDQLGVALHMQSAGQVKPWATDERLAAWGLTAPNRHHRDAARHALYCAVTAGYLPIRAPQEGGEFDD